MYQTIGEGTLKDMMIGVGIIAAIIYISAYSPLMGFFCSFCIPLPVIFYHIKLGRNMAAIIAGLPIVGLMIIIGSFSIEVLFYLEYMVLGFALAEMFKRNYSLEKTILYTCAAVLAIGLSGLIFYSNLLNKALFVLISEYVRMNLELSLKLYQDMGVSEDAMRMLSDSLNHIHYMLVRILPGLLAASVLFMVWMTVLMIRPILRHRNLSFPDFGQLNHWKPPDILVWSVIASGLMLLIPFNPVKILGLNGVIILMTIYFLGGIAIVSFYFEKKRFPFLLKFFLYSLIALQQLLILLIVGLGFFDIWVNFRKLNESEE